MDFMSLYFELRNAVPASGKALPAGFLHREILVPAMPALRRELEPLARHATPGPAPEEDRWSLYALSRVSDFLLLAFQAPESPGAAKGLSGAAGAVGDAPAAHPQITLSPEEYLAFFEALGFRPFGRRGEPFVPFFHEVVAVRSDSVCPQPVVEEVVWPGMMFGQLLFSRAGAVVRSRPDDLDPRIAAGSTLYFTFRRAARPTSDFSRG